METCIVGATGVVLQAEDGQRNEQMLHVLAVLRGRGVKVLLDCSDFNTTAQQQHFPFLEQFCDECLDTDPFPTTKAAAHHSVALMAQREKLAMAEQAGLTVVKFVREDWKACVEKLQEAMGDAGDGVKLCPDGSEDTIPTTLYFDCGRNGGRLVMDAYGLLTKQVVIFLHGGGQTRYTWDLTARKVAAEGFCAVCVDLKGHGDSYWDTDTECDDRYHMDSFARDLDSLCVSLGRKQPILVGASLGGLSILYSMQASKNAKAIALVDIAPRMQESGVSRIVSWMKGTAEQGFASMEDAVKAVAAYNPSRAQSRSVEGDKGSQDARLQGLMKNLRFNESKQRYFWHWDPDFITQKSYASQAALDASAESFNVHAATIKCPTILIRGENTDIVSEDDARAFLALVPSASFVDVNEAGHMVAGDQNDVFSRELLNFITKVQASRL